MEVDGILLNETETLEAENDEEDDEMQVTPAEVIELMEEAWLNEKFAPEILPNKSEIVDCLLGQIRYMEENLKNLDSKDFKKSLHQLEVDRLRFLISSYLRTRLEKIELYGNYILTQENERISRGEDTYLTENETRFVKDCVQAMDQHFEGISSLITTGGEDWKNQPIKPNIHSFVFLKSKEVVEGVVLDEGNSEETDIVDFDKGSQLLISYNSVSNLVKKGDVHLI